MQTRVIILGLLFPVLAMAADNFDREQVRKRIHPIGQVRIAKDPSESSQVDKALPKPEKQVVEQEPGQKIYEQYCRTCHQNGLAGAPKYRVKADWKTRMAEKDMATLVANAIKGINAMPPKGTCMSCSDEDIRLAVEYMVPQS